MLACLLTYLLAQSRPCSGARMHACLLATYIAGSGGADDPQATCHFSHAKKHCLFRLSSVVAGRMSTVTLTGKSLVWDSCPMGAPWPPTQRRHHHGWMSCVTECKLCGACTATTGCNLGNACPQGALSPLDSASEFDALQQLDAFW